MSPVRYFALVVCSVLTLAALVGGCGTAQMVTMKAEFAASALNSACFHAIDGVDAEVTDKIRVENLNGDHDKAVQAYADYKPKIEKARAVCNASDDTVQNAERERLKIPVGGDTKNYEAWLPALQQAAALVTQMLVDIKGFLK